MLFTIIRRAKNCGYFLWNFMELAVKNHMAIKSAMTAKTDLKVIWPAGILNTKEDSKKGGKNI